MTNDKQPEADAEDELRHSSLGFRHSASRLCTACGMCCNGVLFEIVRLQPQDSVKELEKLGMQINRRKTQPYFKQPCRFLDDCTCTIYEQRPTRCRRFECLQLKLLAAEEITEAEAAAKIEEARAQVQRVQDLLTEAGDHAVDEALEERARRVLADQTDTPLHHEMQTLKKLLNRDFRSLTD
jgi:Fe-S-cluster containining protein